MSKFTDHLKNPLRRAVPEDYFARAVEKTAAGLLVARDPLPEFHPNRAMRRMALRASRLRGRGYTKSALGRKIPAQDKELAKLRLARITPRRVTVASLPEMGTVKTR